MNTTHSIITTTLSETIKAEILDRLEKSLRFRLLSIQLSGQVLADLRLVNARDVGAFSPGLHYPERKTTEVCWFYLSVAQVDPLSGNSLGENWIVYLRESICGARPCGKPEGFVSIHCSEAEAHLSADLFAGHNLFSDISPAS